MSKIEDSTVLGYDAHSDCYLLTFRRNLLPSSLGLKKSPHRFLYFLNLDDGSRNLLHNIDKYLPINKPS